MKNGPYILVIAPDNYPGKKYRNRYVYEHHLVYWKKTKKLIKIDEVIHHINENKTDNRIENLELLSKEEHKEHHTQRYCAVILCKRCSKWQQRGLSNHRFNLNSGKNNFYCSKKCLHESLKKIPVGGASEPNSLLMNQKPGA